MILGGIPARVLGGSVGQKPKDHLPALVVQRIGGTDGDQKDVEWCREESLGLDGPGKSLSFVAGRRAILRAGPFAGSCSIIREQFCEQSCCTNGSSDGADPFAEQRRVYHTEVPDDDQRHSMA